MKRIFWAFALIAGIFPLLSMTKPVAAAKVAPSQAAVLQASLVDCPFCKVDLQKYTGPLKQAEVEGLLRALNDEYHAWAVYAKVTEDLGQVRPFTNIQRAEAWHINTLKGLLTRYAVTIPPNPWVGNVPTFATRQAACAAGVQAELDNAGLYDQLLTTTQRADILQVYRALQRASNQNHLRAFQRCA